MQGYSNPFNKGANYHNDISSVLESMQGASKLILSDSFIGDDGAKHVASFLNQNPYVQVIDLKCNFSKNSDPNFFHWTPGDLLGTFPFN
jgi:hypothetical protein